MKGLRPWLEQIANTLSNAEKACFAQVGPKLREKIRSKFPLAPPAPPTKAANTGCKAPRQGLGLGLSQPAPPL